MASTPVARSAAAMCRHGALRRRPRAGPAARAGRPSGDPSVREVAFTGAVEGGGRDDEVTERLLDAAK
ncbi:hypothetical protein [Streptomyces sp. NPDC048584]|uniref:hypothetical protein n=1 Tax=Streptomyces sp. NPDC048584 TaxID=3365573 RepID=UPI00371BF55E